MLKEFPTKKPHKRDDINAVSVIPDLGAKRQHKALLYVDVYFEDVFDVQACIDKGAGRTLVKRRVFRQFFAACFTARHNDTHRRKLGLGSGPLNLQPSYAPSDPTKFFFQRCTSLD